MHSELRTPLLVTETSHVASDLFFQDDLDPAACVSALELNSSADLLDALYRERCDFVVSTCVAARRAVVVSSALCILVLVSLAEVSDPGSAVDNRQCEPHLYFSFFHLPARLLWDTVA